MVYGASPHGARREEFVLGEYARFDFGLAPRATVLDAGANIGLFSLELLRRYEGHVRIFACVARTEIVCVSRAQRA
jgi:hypothetical protein